MTNLSIALAAVIASASSSPSGSSGLGVLLGFLNLTDV